MTYAGYPSTKTLRTYTHPVKPYRYELSFVRSFSLYVRFGMIERCETCVDAQPI